jgi:hypothetical protein
MGDMFVTLIVAAIGAGGTSPEIQVPRWQPYDFAFQSRHKHENPFTLPFSATLEGPNGERFDTLGFYDGGETWKIRVSPNAEGRWTLRTHSDDPDLDGRSVSFICVPNDNPFIHGSLLVDPNHPRHFIFEDGTRYFLMGYECDWLWALDMGDPNLPTLNRFLDKLRSHGFNHIIMNAYAHDTSWRRGKTDGHDYGPPPMYAWEGTNEDPDHSRFNLAYWRHYDRVIEALHRRGIIAHIMIKVYNKMVNWPQKGGTEDDLYFRWLIARYAAYPNVVWDFSKEAHNEKDIEYKLSRLQLIRKYDPYHRPITVHDDDVTYESGAYDDLLDFRSDQNHREWHETILRQRGQHVWPVVNVEFGYEHGPKGLEDRTYGVVQPPEEVCRRAWEVCMAGGYAAYYYTYTAWDVIRPDDTPPGYSYFKHLRRFFEDTRYWMMEPADDLVSDGYCLANPGREYIVFLDRAKRFRLRLEGLSEPLDAEWFHPFTGERTDAGKVAGGTIELSPPADWREVPVVLHIGSSR